MRLPLNSTVLVSIEDQALTSMVLDILSPAVDELTELRCSYCGHADHEPLPPLCVVTDGVHLNQDSLRTLRAKTWPAPAVFLSDGYGHRFAIHSGVYTVLEAPFIKHELQNALLETLIYAKKLAEHFRRRQNAQAALATLSSTQQIALRYILDCHPNKVIAKHLGVSVRTIDYRKQQIFQKLNVKTLRELFDLVSIAGEKEWELQQSETRPKLLTPACANDC